METYQVVIREYLEKKVEIEAEAPSLAVCAVEEKYNNAEVVLSADNHSGTDIALSAGDKLCGKYLQKTLFRTFVDDKLKQMIPIIEYEEKMRLAFGSPDNAIFEFENRSGADKAVCEINSEVEKVNLDTPFYNKVFISGKLQLCIVIIVIPFVDFTFGILNNTLHHTVAYVFRTQGTWQLFQFATG